MITPELKLDYIYIGDVLKKLKCIPDKSVRCCVSSPPYYGLRDYNTSSWIGGDTDCKHEGQKRKSSTGRVGENTKQSRNPSAKEVSIGDCVKCGAIRVDQQIGLEKTPELYIEKLVNVFREVRRILTDDGTLWLNIGDSYWGSGNSSGHTDQTQNMGTKTSLYGATKGNAGRKHPDIKPKDLIGIPWMLAFALRKDGWYLRSDIIWFKRNPMPESVTDRPTKAHEYIFLFSKSPKYFYDDVAIRQPLAELSIARLQQDIENQAGSSRANGNTRSDRPMKTVYRKSGNLERKDRPGAPEETGRHQMGSVPWEGMTANKKTVWDVPTKPFKDAHFACVDQETECLTNRGWKKYDEILMTDEILSYNVVSKTLEHQKIKGLYVYNVDTDIVVVKGRDLDIKMTKNHRCVILKRTNNGYVECVKEADELNSRDSIRVSANLINHFSNEISKDK